MMAAFSCLDTAGAEDGAHHILFDSVGAVAKGATKKERALRVWPKCLIAKLKVVVDPARDPPAAQFARAIL